jgi:hypothetical protein
MKKFSMAIGIVGLVGMLVPAPARAQASPKTPLTTDELALLAEELGAVLRFRQMSDTLTLPKGGVDLGVQFASAPIDDAAGTWNVARFVARFGAGDRVDIGAWGGYTSKVRDGMAGVDAKIALLRQGPSMPVSVSVRPSFSTLFGTADVWAGNIGVDLSVSRSFGAFAPYGGIAATSSMATDRLRDIDFERVSTGQTLAYAGVSYNWRQLIATAELEKGTKVSYAVRLGTRF